MITTTKYAQYCYARKVFCCAFLLLRLGPISRARTNQYPQHRRVSQETSSAYAPFETRKNHAIAASMKATGVSIA
jgi:hypothetical protein